VGLAAGGHGDGHLIGDGEAVAFERDQFARMIGEHAQLGQAEIDQNLRADAAFVLQLTLLRRTATQGSGRQVTAIASNPVNLQ
jgi:YD repeat-containing protein